jgi:hypothetical protein
MKKRILAAVLTAIALGSSPGRAQNVEEVKPVFEHAIPNIEGRRMVAVVVTYPPGGKSPVHHLLTTPDQIGLAIMSLTITQVA